MSDDLYARLSAKFDQTFTDRRGGIEITYISGEQVVTRLNTELGVLNWNFRVLEHGFHPEADEMWVLGELSVFDGDKVIVRQQFGSDKIQRSRSTGSPLDIGFDYKSAATDCLKKCASLIGIGLYLSEHRAPPNAVRQPRQIEAAFTCQEEGCGQPVTAHEFSDGTRWSVQEIVDRGKRFDKILCYSHLRARSAA